MTNPAHASHEQGTSVYDSPMSSSKPPIRFCINNPRNLAERQDLIARDIPSKDCLGNCTACFNGRFLEIEGELVEGESYQEILEAAPKNK